MSSIWAHFRSTRSVRHSTILVPLLLACVCAPGLSVTIASHGFGQSSIGNPSVQQVSVPTVTPGPAVFSLRYSIDFSLGACTPNANGCDLSVSFDPAKPGLRQDAVIVKDANGQIVEEILLHGIGLGPLPVFSPALATLDARIPGQSGPFGPGIASEPNSKMLVLSAGVIYEFDPATNTMAAVPGLPEASGFTNSIYEVATDAAGNIYYGIGSELHRFDAISGADSLIASSVNPDHMIVDASGVIFYVESDRVYKLAQNGTSPVVIAGNGIYGYAGDGGGATAAELNCPCGIALDLAGNLYIGDGRNHRVRKVDMISGVISTVAGTGITGDTGDGGPALDAGLDFPSSLVSDAAGDLYVSNLTGQVRRIDAGTGLISTIAGANPQTSGSSTQNPFLGVGFTASAQNLGVRGSMALDPDGNLWIAEAIYPSGQALYEISSSAFPIAFPFTIAGQSQTQTVALLNAGTADLSQPVLGITGQTDFSSLSDCSGPVTAGRTCNINITFTAGAHATSVATVTVSDNAVSSPQAIPVSGASGGLAPASQQIAAVPVGASSSTPQTVSVQFPGNASGLTARLAYGNEFRLGSLSCSGLGIVSCSVPVTFAPLYPGLRQDAIQFLDSSGAVVYQCFLTGTGQGPQWFVDPGVLGQISMPNPAMLAAIDTAGNLYAFDNSVQIGAKRIYKFSKQTNQWVIIAGQSFGGNVDTGDGGPATSASLAYLNAMAFDPAGNLYIAETFKIRRVDARTGIITTIATQGGDSIVIDQRGSVYIGSSTYRKVWKLDPSSGAISGFAGNGGIESAGDGGPAILASLDHPQALALDNDGNLLIAESYHIRKVDVTSGIITTYANTCGTDSIAIDPAGNLYLPCGELMLVPTGPGTPHFVETGVLVNIFGSILRDPTGTFYASTGTTLSPALNSPFDMPSAVVNGAPSSATIGLTNAGSSPLTVNSVTLSGTNAIAFSESNTCIQSLAPAQNCAVNLTFTPAQQGNLTADLAISSTLSNLETTLNGTGELASIYYVPNMSFGNVLVGTTWSGTVYLQNPGLYPLSILNISISGPDASDFSVQSDCPSILTSYQWCQPRVYLRASAAGVRTATLTITDDAAGSPQTIALWATAYPAQYTAGGFTLAQGASMNFGSLTLVMQGDGNLVLYRSGTPIWNTGTYGQNCGSHQCFAAFQGDGNFVVYNGLTPLWNSQTYRNPGAQLVFSPQSPQLRIISGNGSILWTNVPKFDAGNLTLSQGASLNFGDFILAMQGDGNLVLYQGGTAVWNTGTYGQNCGSHQCFAAFQGDGNFVVYNSSIPLWNSQTYRNPGAQLVFSAQAPQLRIVSNNGSILWTDLPRFDAGNLTLPQGAFLNFGDFVLAMQGDGNLVLYQGGTAVWNTGTYGQYCGANQCAAVFQGDGNFVVYNGSTPLWNSQTYRNPGAQLVFSAQAPQLKIAAGNQSILWTN